MARQKKEEEELLAVRGVPAFILCIATCKGVKPIRLSNSPVLESLCRRQVELYISSDLSVPAKKRLRFIVARKAIRICTTTYIYTIVN